MKRLISLVLALVMVLMVGAAFATDGGTGSGAAGSITVTTPDNTEAASKNTYVLYKVFDAVTDGKGAYSYKLTENQSTVPTGFILDDGGNVYFAEEVETGTEGSFKVLVNGTEKVIKNKTSLSTTDIANIAAYVVAADKIGEEEITGPGSVVFDNLDDGYYYVTSTTGALVIIDSTKPAVTIKDKNEVPPMDKKITEASSIDDAGKKAIAQVGTSIEYTLTITKKTGAENYVVYDTMGTGLKYNKDAKVYIGENEIVNVEGETNKYTKTTETDTALTISFDNTWVNSLANDTEIKVVYTALITEDALHTDPAKNTAHLEYGHNPGDNKTPPKTTETYNATLEVIKQDGKGAALSGAGFVLKNEDDEYYKYTPATGTAPEKVEWVASIGDATEYISGDDGKLNGKFSGLADGTYTLIEKTVPTGYNKAADYEFTIAEKDFTGTNLLKSTTVVNNAGTELPSTGGIGTTIFYVVGGLLLIGAAVVLVARRKASN